MRINCSVTYPFVRSLAIFLISYYSPRSPHFINCAAVISTKIADKLLGYVPFVRSLAIFLISYYSPRSPHFINCAAVISSEIADKLPGYVPFVLLASRHASVAAAFLACRDVTKSLQTKRQRRLPFLYIENLRPGRCIFFVFFVNSCFLLIGFFVCRERNMSGKENAETEVPGKKRGKETA